MEEARGGGKGMRHGAAAGFMLGIAAMAVAGIVAALWLRPQADPSVTPAAIPQAEPQRQAASAPPAVSAPEAKAQAGADPQTEPADGLPALDLLRVNPDGTALVAGRGWPGAQVIVLIDGVEAMPVRVDARGQFATFVALTPRAAPQLLSLRMEDRGREAIGAEEVVIAPSAGKAVADGGTATDGAPAQANRASAMTGPAAGEAAIPAVGVAAVSLPDAAVTGERASAAGHADAAPAPDGGATAVMASAGPTETAAAIASAPGQTASAVTPPPAPILVALGPEGPRVLAPVRGLSIDSVSYEAGGLRLGGRSEGPGTVRLYIDGTLAGDAPVAGDGSWHFPLPGLGGGVHAARADRLDPEGRVAARVELPFAADPGAMASSAGTGDAPVSIATVQPGESLWRISQRRYGSGERYIRLYEANRSQIRDPDLIYPGQVFTLPGD